MRGYTEINGIKVDNKIFTEKFCCDYAVCKGACCNKPLDGVELNGGSLTDEEADEIFEHRGEVSRLCAEEDRLAVVENPIYEEEGTWYITLREEKCVLCNMEKGTCSLKLAKESGIVKCGIPLSCELYPIVMEGDNMELSDLFDGFCACAYDKGKRDGVFLLDFLRNPLIRGFGKDFYNELKRVQMLFL